MALSPPTPPQTNGTISSLGKPLVSDKGLQVALGQTLAATVVKISNGQALLNIAGQTILARLPQQTLTEGQQLQAKVTQIKPSVVLTFSSPQAISTANTSSTIAPEKLIQQLLTQILPNQTSISHGMAQLVQLTQTGNLPTAIQGYLFKLFDSLFKLTGRVKPEEFQAALLSSGLFLESAIAKNKQPPQNDFKANLLKLLNLVQSQSTQSPELKTLAKTLQQLLNKITHQQVQAIENPNTWQVQIPTTPDHSLIEFQLDIRKTPTQSDAIWETIISLELEDMGTLITKCTLQNEEFGFQFWAEKPTLKMELETQIETFRHQLNQNGLKIKHVLINQQKPEANPMATKIALIDIKV